ncbi:MAG: glutamine synthetase III [Chitinispirillaceae bacterium]|nr:glutamine synthetase III [Chitinispirillaceae bacterium]
MSKRTEATLTIKAVDVEKVAKPAQVSEYYGINTFSELVMKKMVSERTFKAFKKWQEEGAIISMSEADEIAHAMKEWAIERGATSYTHWFQPMTGLTAEKHDSFISITGPCTVMEKFTGSKLIVGEPDASSFPSGGIRATFEARGYTAWDPSSPAFIIEVEAGKTLTIPTIFVSYTGEALDKKLPLLRSDQALSKAAIELLTLFGVNDVKNVYSTCGPEQEYFLIDESYYRMRPDLLFSGRTLCGAPSPKGQQLEDQYFGSIKERMLNFMFEVSEEAFKLGIPVTTRHNEVAPHQYEFAPIFERSNLAADHNQILMDLMKKVAGRHGLVCLLHEKPFAGINGSGKHVNWSLADDKGNNLLNPGDTPEENLQFMTVLTAVIHAVYTHADLLRAAVASAGNEHRLGANEAPPAIVSVYLGEQLIEIMKMLESGRLEKAKKKDLVDFGVGLLPNFVKDTSDRNRTSPFAFTGSKFEFRAVGSSMNISTSIAVINTIVADSMKMLAEKIRAEAGNGDIRKVLLDVLSGAIKESRAILFEGNNYSDEWVKEAEKRGLPNVASTAEALRALVTPKAVKLFGAHNVFSKVELTARYHIWLETYEKIIDIEARTLVDIAKTLVLPAAFSYQKECAEGIVAIHGAGIKLSAAVADDRKEMLTSLSEDIYFVRKNVVELEGMLGKVHVLDLEKKTAYLFTTVKPQMEHVRRHIDALESVMPDDLWLLPKYREMLFIS